MNNQYVKILTKMDEINDKCKFEKYESVRVSCLKLNLVKNTVFDG